MQIGTCGTLGTLETRGTPAGIRDEIREIHETRVEIHGMRGIPAGIREETHGIHGIQAANRVGIRETRGIRSGIHGIRGGEGGRIPGQDHGITGSRMIFRLGRGIMRLHSITISKTRRRRILRNVLRILV